MEGVGVKSGVLGQTSERVFAVFLQQRVEMWKMLVYNSIRKFERKHI